MKIRNSRFLEEYKEDVVKRGDKWCVVHGHAKKKGSKRDKPKGSVIGCHDTAKKAWAQHYAITQSQKRRKKK